MEDATDRIRFALDLGFSDGYRDENVRDHTIAGRHAALQCAITLMHAEEAINFSLSQALGHEHPSPQIYALDFPSDVRASLYALLGGYYKQAILCLRNWMEMRMLGIYFGLVDRSRYEAWKLGTVTKADALYGETLVRRLFQRAEFHKADSRTGFRSRLLAIYGELSVFAHGQGVLKHRLQDETDNVPRYNERSVDLHFELFGRAFSEVVYMLWLAYGPDAFRGLGDEHAAAILEGVGAPYAAELRDPLADALRSK